MVWKLKTTDDYKRRFKRFAKKHRRELQAALSNLDRFLGALNAGASSLQARRSFGFIHREPGGVVAIDQKGGGPHLAETRLYVYAVEIEHVLYLITLGDKTTQKDDLRVCREFVSELAKAKLEARNRGDQQDLQ